MNIILASASPRRREILENTNVKFDVISSSIEELVLDGESPCQMVMRLAFEKGIDIASKHKTTLIVRTQGEKKKKNYCHLYYYSQLLVHYTQKPQNLRT